MFPRSLNSEILTFDDTLCEQHRIPFGKINAFDRQIKVTSSNLIARLKHNPWLGLVIDEKLFPFIEENSELSSKHAYAAIV